MRQHPCPVCGRPVDPATTPAMPFCSDRCRQIDLARWLGERYRVPGPVRQPEEALEESPSEQSSSAEAGSSQDEEPFDGDG
ncbi:MAG TPA: DNA gyrase inhibitor YacG [Thermoguttaceae bacterium]|nr:DNA gyrase inhibitor YacG [Thermoguttaceae bacterium]HPP51721.1 DNA gyrase inhibitor YacG [Thermoguttaceae bacterium]